MSRIWGPGRDSTANIALSFDLLWLTRIYIIIIIIIIIIIWRRINHWQFCKLCSVAINSLVYDKRHVGFLRRLQISEMLSPRSCFWRFAVVLGGGHCASAAAAADQQVVPACLSACNLASRLAAETLSRRTRWSHPRVTVLGTKTD